MKTTTSKYDQARAMREARYVVEPLKQAVSIESIERAMNAEPELYPDPGPAPNRALRKSSKPASIAASIAPFLAPEGQCPSCDRRRKALYAAQKKRRAKQKASGDRTFP